VKGAPSSGVEDHGIAGVRVCGACRLVRLLEDGLRRQDAAGAWPIVSKFVQMGLFLQILIYGLEQLGPILELVMSIAPVCRHVGKFLGDLDVQGLDLL
jgi:hypothetical protein